MISQSGRKIGPSFTRTDGTLWRYTAGYSKDDDKEGTDVYHALQGRFRGNDTSAFSYTTGELDDALSTGHTEKTFLRKLIGARDPVEIYIDKKGRTHLLPSEHDKNVPYCNIHEDEEEESSTDPQNYADDAIKQLQQKIKDIREQNLPIEQKQKLIFAIRLQILSYQNMKLQDERAKSTT